MHRLLTVSVTTAALTTLAAATIAAAPADAAPSPRSWSGRAVTAGSLVRTCPAAYRNMYFSSTTSRPVHKVHVASTVRRPIGLDIPRSMALYGVANDRTPPPHSKSVIGYQTLAGPTSFACSGIGVSEDDVSWATFRSAKYPSHSISAMFGQGQEAFPAMCSYLLGANRPAEARAWARTYAGKVRDCRKETADAPVSARLRQIPVTGKRSGPTVVLIHAPAGSEFTGHAFTPRGQALPQRRTTTPTISVAIFSYKNTRSFTFPQTLDCSLPSVNRSKCATSAAVFIDEALQGSYGWSPRGAAHVARRVANAIG